jgi:hypothetical protein
VGLVGSSIIDGSVLEQGGSLVDRKAFLEFRTDLREKRFNISEVK